MTALYSTFAVGSFFAGTFINVLGVKKSLFIGSLGYVLYVASLLTYNIKKDQVSAFVIASGAILGLGAALLWTAQATVMLSLPAEDEKGRFISIFWILFNMGDVIGSAILLGENHEHDTAGSLSTAGYSIFVGLTALGSSLAFLLVSPRKITRSDGTRVITPIHPSWKSEMWGLVRCLKNDPMILLCFPFFAGEFLARRDLFSGSVSNRLFVHILSQYRTSSTSITSTHSTLGYSPFDLDR